MPYLPAPMSSSPSRMPLIDMVKGVACITIVWHHLAFYGPMSDIAQPLAPALTASLGVFDRMPGLDVWARYFLGACDLGVLACWAVRAASRVGWLSAMVLLG